MSDLIDRQAAIDMLDKHLRTTDVPVSYPGIISALTEWLNELPSAQPDSKETSSTHKALDTISRQAAIRWVKTECKPYGKPTFDFESGKKVIEHLKQMPSAQPEQRWVPVTEKLPEERGFYLVSVGSPYKTVRVYEYKPCEGYENENLWKNNDGSYCFNWFVEAWMPLPEPWKEGEADG